MTSDRYGTAYQRGFDLTVRFLISRGLQRDNAEEVAQAAWVKGLERLSQLRNESFVVMWVNTIALNVYRNSLRRKPLPVTELRDKTARLDLAAIDVARILTFCRPCDRRLLEQSMVGVTPGEIANEQGVTETAIRIRLLRARREVRSRVERRTFSSGVRKVAARNFDIFSKRKTA
jgi:DNA-directed RNA polymerase specialized sigma24 family protein